MRKRLAILASLAALVSCGPSAADQAAARIVAAPISVAYAFEPSNAGLTPGIPKGAEFTDAADTYHDTNIGDVLVRLGYARLYHAATSPFPNQVNTYIVLTNPSPPGWKCAIAPNPIDAHKLLYCAIPIGTMIASDAKSVKNDSQNDVVFTCTPEPNDIGKMLTLKIGGVATPGAFNSNSITHDGFPVNRWTFGQPQTCSSSLNGLAQ